MNFQKIAFTLIFIFAFSVLCAAQQTKKNVGSPAVVSNTAIKFTHAYAEILLRRTELESILEDLLVAYTEDFPKVKEARYELSLIEKDLAKLLATNANSATISPALGKLMVRRAALAADLRGLQTKYGDDHPDVKRASRRVSIFDKAIAEIFP